MEVTKREFDRLKRDVRDALYLSSTHDPDHDLRLSIVERRLDRLGAPQYRSPHQRKGRAKRRKKVRAVKNV